MTTDLPLDSQVKSLSSTFKKNLGIFLSRVQQQAANETGAPADIEGLLTDLDRVISNQKELSELIQKVKLHQKISKELDGTNENIKSTQASILALIDDLRQRDLNFANRILKAQTFKTNLKALEAIINDPESAIVASMNLAITTGAPADWNPSLPLLNNKPPYPTEDLIRRSALYQMMTQQQHPAAPSASSQPAQSTAELSAQEIPEVKASAPVRGRRRAADKSKLLDLDLNPDL